MLTQNVMIVVDRQSCTAEEGEPVKRYILGVFERVAQEVARVNPSRLDLLVVSSDDLVAITWGSQNMFEDRLNEALEKAGRKEKCLRFGSYGTGGAVNENTLIRNTKEKLKTDSVELHYLTPERNLGISYAAYHLTTENNQSLNSQTASVHIH